jgi:hypothetical protein
VKHYKIKAAGRITEISIDDGKAGDPRFITLTSAKPTIIITYTLS